ncbi:MAG: PilN domain-containing protein [Candidatus Omnitrophica bacterium]|nr:PilN domain-containing protein [Candidatus Omnitrophota bacterium]
MIKVNLLPAHLKRKESAGKSAPDSLYKIPMYPIMAVVFILVLIVHIVLGLFSFNRKMQIDSLDKTSKRVQAQSKEIENIKKDIIAKKDKLKILEPLLKKDIYWTSFLNKVNQAVPKGLWLTNLSFSNRGLTIKGSVFSFEADEVSLVNSFFDVLKNDSFFSDNFVDFNIGSMQRRGIKQYEVLDFVLTAEEKKKEEKTSDEHNNKRKR